MTSREIVRATVRFQSPERIPYDFPEPYGSDFYRVEMAPHPDFRPPASGTDEWGVVWRNIGTCTHGEAEDSPLKEWSDLDSHRIPDADDPARWKVLEGIREKAGDKFLLGTGTSIWERVHFLRGLQNAWMDIHSNPGELQELVDILVGMNLTMIRHYAELGYDGFLFADDWGLQNRLMISPEKWREIWKPRYATIYKAAHEAGLVTFLHSCGYIVDILDDLIEVGLDVIHMDQQENMGLELLGERFGGRLTFFSPVDVQKTMASGDLDAIRAYAHRMVHTLGRPEGGFIPRWYTDPVGAGHTPEALDVMCREFLRISHGVAAACSRWLPRQSSG